MSTTTIRPETLIDPVTDRFGVAEAKEIAATSGPWVCITMPTPRSGPDTRRAPRDFGRLVDSIRDDVPESLHEQLLAPLAAVERDDHFWQYLADGLAVFSGCETFHLFRLSSAVGELPSTATFGSVRLAHLVPWLGPDQEFHVLALSQGRTRVFRGTRDTFDELTLDSMPPPRDEMETDRDHQQSMQWGAQGGGDRTVHSHGADSRADRLRTLKHVREVGAAIDAELDPRVPLLLASVPENAALFRECSSHPHLLDEVLAGNADRLTPAQLHAQAWPLIEHRELKRLDAEFTGGHAALIGTGRLINEHREILRMASHGRVEQLLVDPELESTEPRGDLDLAIQLVLTHGGLVSPAPASAGAGSWAVLRW